uniref:Solute carrier family 38 member 5b n=1 Tax=Scleropages formosus TaxID=113540 RepID=A0A8C9SYY2_SCLFO
MELQRIPNGNSEKIHLENGYVSLWAEKKLVPHLFLLLFSCMFILHSQFAFTFFYLGKTSFGMSVFNLSNAIMGSGVLGLAYAMSNTGIVLFLCLLTCIAVLSSYSIHLLLTCAGVVGIRAFEQLGKRAFGKTGKVLSAATITVHNIGGMSTYLFIVKYELPLVIQAFLGQHTSSGEWYFNGNNLIIIVSICIILPLALMRHLGYLGYTSGLSLTCMVFFLISVSGIMGTTLPNIVFYNSQHLVCITIYSIGSWNLTEDDVHLNCFLMLFVFQTVYTVPILAFAFVCHPEVLPIYTELRNPTQKRMQAIANVSIFAMFTMYLLTATFGYLTFYANVEAELLHMYSKVDPLDTLILCVRLAVLMAVTLTVPVVLFPIRRALLQLLFPKKPFHWVRHTSIAVCLLFIVNLFVIFVPNIRDIFGIIGATTAPSVIFILPGLFYIRIIKDKPMTSRSKIQAACFAAFGFIFMVMSLTFIILDWVNGESRSGGGH